MSIFQKSMLRNAALVVGVIIGLATFSSSQVSAVSQLGPDPADYTDPETYMEVATGGGGSLEAPTAQVVIYSTVQNPRIIIHHFHHCTNPGFANGIDATNIANNLGGDTLFQLYQGGDPTVNVAAWPAFMNQVKSPALDPNCASQDAVMTPTLTDRGTVGSGTEQYWTARLKASMVYGAATNAFRVEVQDAGGNPGGYVSFTQFDNARFSLQRRPVTANGQSDFNLKFAMPCDYPNIQSPSITWYDDDIGDQQADNLWFELKERPRGTPGNDWSGVPAIYQNGTGAGDGSWGGPGNPGNPLQSQMSFTPTLRKDMEYNWVWHNVNNSNGVQFAIPYGSIFSKVTCIAYSLTPALSVSSGTVEPGSVVTASPSVNNAGPTDSAATQWQVSRFTLVSGEAIPNAGGGTSAGAPCAGFYKTPPNCSVLASGNQSFPVGNTGLAAVNNQVDDLPAGSRICYALSVQPHRHDTTDWRHSAPVCVKIGKKPKAQIWGNDVMVRGNISTSTSTKIIAGSPRTFGSWGEYGVFSLGNNNAAASGSGLAGGGSSSPSQSSWSKLTFANKGGVFGSYGASTALPVKPAIANYYLTRTSTPLAPGAVSLTGKDGILRYDGGANITINASTIGANKSVVILAPNANVTIVGNIDYSNGPFTSVSQIPQVIIIATNIWIKGSVSNVDSWLVASSAVITCNDVAVGAQLSTNICNVPLTINGPVISQSVYLRRTAGSNTGPASGDPAELINLRADAYVWANSQAATDGNATTVFSYEVPPRF